MQVINTKTEWVHLGLSTANAQPFGADILVSSGSWLQLVSISNPQQIQLYQAATGIQVAASHRTLPCIAYAETGENPRVFILMRSGWKTVQTLAAVKECTFLALEFGELELLVGLVRRLGTTDVIVWNWRSGEVVNQFTSAVQNLTHTSIRVSWTSPLRIAEWHEKRLDVWLTHACYKKTIQSRQSFDLDHVVPPIHVAWTAEATLYVTDALGSLFLANFETCTLEKEFDSAQSSSVTEPLPTPCLVPYSGGWAVYAAGEVKFVKKKVDRWVNVWACPRDDVTTLMATVVGVKEMLTGWTKENKLILFKGEKSVEVLILRDFGSGVNRSFFIHPEDRHFVTYADFHAEISVRALENGAILPNGKITAVEGISTSCSSPWEAVIVTTFAHGVVRIIHLDGNSSTLDLFLTEHPVDAVRFTPNKSKILAVAARQMGDVFLLTTDGEQPLGFLQSKSPIIDFFIEEMDSGISLVTLETGNILRRYKLEGKEKSFVKILQVTLTDCFHQILPHGGGVLALSASSANLIILSKIFEVSRTIKTPHTSPPILAKLWQESFMTCGSDGLLLCHDSDGTVQRQLSTPFNDIEVLDFDFTADLEYLMAVGRDNSLVCFTTSTQVHRQLQPTSAYVNLEWKPFNLPDETWLQTIEAEKASEIAQDFAEQKSNILNSLQKVKKQIGDLLDANEATQPNEQLSVSDFELDILGRKRTEDEHKKRRDAACELELARIRLQDELSKRIIAYSQDSIQTPSREIRAIIPSKGIKPVQSYAIIVDKAEGLEWAEGRKDLLRHFQHRDFFAPWLPDGRVSLTGGELSNELKVSQRSTGFSSGFIVQDNRTRLQCNPTSTHAFLPEVRPLEHSEIQVRTVCYAHDIMQETQQVIKKLMEYFNSKFASVAAEKTREMSSLNDRRKRLSYLRGELEELGAACPEVTEEIEPKWADTEFPETILTVSEDELMIAPYLSPEEEEAAREAAAEAETKRRLLLADDFRERALHVMMDGVLHNLWQHQIKRDIHPPKFMSEKDASEWSEDENRKAKAYRDASEKLKVERERYEKLLGTEFKQLTKTNKESGAKFDEKVIKLSELKLRVESAVCQEQLNILRMRQHILKRIKISRKINGIKSAIAEETKKVEKLGAQVGKLQQISADARAAAETFLTRDKNLEKNFRKDFSEFSTIICEQLHKLAKKRPKFTGTWFTSSSLLNELGRLCTQVGDGAPTTCLPLPLECVEYLKSLEVLDSAVNCPAVVSELSWEKLIRVRRVKIDSELKVRALSIEVTETDSTIAYWQKRVKSTRDGIVKMQAELDTLHNEMRMSELDCPMQMVVPQRIVEVATTGNINDFADAVLLSRSVVDVVNTEIQNVGLKKIEALQKACKYRKNILYKEWEHQKLRLQVRELQAQLDDIEHVHVTRELQDILAARSRGLYEEKGYAHLENEIHAVKMRYEKDKFGLLHAIEDYERKIIGLDMENAELDKEIVSLNNTIGRRSMQRDVKAEDQSSHDTKKRMNRIILESRMKAKSKSLANELASLQAERDLLMLRVHPTIIHA